VNEKIHTSNSVTPQWHAKPARDPQERVSQEGGHATCFGRGLGEKEMEGKKRSNRGEAAAQAPHSCLAGGGGEKKALK